MATVEKVRIYNQIIADFTSYPLRVGRLDVEQAEFDVTGNRYDVSEIVADNYGVVTLWEDGDGGITDFDFGYLESDKECLVELHDAESDISIVRPLKPGLPFYIHNEKVKAAASNILSDQSETTDFDSLDRIKVQRNVAEDEGDARVRFVLIA